MLSNESAKMLFEVSKYTEKQTYFAPDHGKTSSIKVFTQDDRCKEEEFIIDINRKCLILEKRTFQLRTGMILRRLDFYSGHQNPEEINYLSANLDQNILNMMIKYKNYRFKKEAHMHLYIDGYADKWAFPLTEFGKFDTSNIVTTIKDFLTYCNVANNPKISSKNVLCIP